MEQLNNNVIKVFSAAALTAADKKKIEEFFKGKHKNNALTSAG
jgi:ABC-type molybdate transport system substrate-binding protein